MVKTEQFIQGNHMTPEEFDKNMENLEKLGKGEMDDNTVDGLSEILLDLIRGLSERMTNEQLQQIITEIENKTFMYNSYVKFGIPMTYEMQEMVTKMDQNMVESDEYAVYKSELLTRMI